MSKIALPYCPQESLCLECSRPTSGESHQTSSLCWMSERALFQDSCKRMGHAHTLLLKSRFNVATDLHIASFARPRSVLLVASSDALNPQSQVYSSPHP